METDYALVIRASNGYSNIFRQSFYYIDAYNPKLKNFNFEIQLSPYDDTQLKLFETCIPGDLIEITAEKPYRIIHNCTHNKRIKEFDKRYALLKRQQKQRN